MGIIKENCRLCQINVGSILLENELCKSILEVTKIEVNDIFFYLLPTTICVKCNTKILETILFIKDIQNVNQHLKDCIEKTYYQQCNDSMNNYSDAEDFKPMETNFKCNLYEDTFTKKEELKQHLVDHLDNTDESFYCKICLKRFSRKSTYIKHKKVHPELYCAKCCVFFDDLKQPDNHHTCRTLNEKKKERTKKKTEKLQSVQKKNEIQSDTQFQCSKCWKQYDNEQMYTDHLESHHKFLCNEENCAKIFKSRKSLKEHRLIHEGKRRFLCVVCGKGFILKKSLMCHEKIHSTIKDYKCKTCNVSFSVNSNLRAHIKTHHEGIRFHCSQCPKEFTSKCTLDRHEKLHTGVKEFVCVECTSAFYTKKELIKHQKYHQGIKPHKCELCFRTFFERHHLLTHIRTHNGERPFVCEIPECGRSFYEKQKLRRHERTVHVSKKKIL